MTGEVAKDVNEPWDDLVFVSSKVFIVNPQHGGIIARFRHMLQRREQNDKRSIHASSSAW